MEVPLPKEMVVIIFKMVWSTLLQLKTLGEAIAETVKRSTNIIIWIRTIVFISIS